MTYYASKNKKTAVTAAQRAEILAEAQKAQAPAKAPKAPKRLTKAEKAKIVRQEARKAKAAAAGQKIGRGLTVTGRTTSKVVKTLWNSVFGVAHAAVECVHSTPALVAGAGAAVAVAVADEYRKA